MTDNIYIAKLGAYDILKLHGEFVGLDRLDEAINSLIKTRDFLNKHYNPDYSEITPIVDEFIQQARPGLVYPFELPKRGRTLTHGVYFATCDLFPDQIKIGYTENIRARMSNHRKRWGESFNPIAFMPHDNPYQLEQMLHLHFEINKTDGEWFEAAAVMYFLENGL